MFEDKKRWGLTGVGVLDHVLTREKPTSRCSTIDR